MIYLCSPYAKSPIGMWPAYKEAARIAGRLTDKGMEIFSPIAHSHPMAMYGNLDPFDDMVWQKRNLPFMEFCAGCLVATMDGWRDSKGVSAEIYLFNKSGKPIRYVDPETLAITEFPLEDAA
jgi:Domain of unknown function (DUF1937)